MCNHSDHRWVSQVWSRWSRKKDLKISGHSLLDASVLLCSTVTVDFVWCVPAVKLPYLYSSLFRFSSLQCMLCSVMTVLMSGSKLLPRLSRMTLSGKHVSVMNTHHITHLYCCFLFCLVRDLKQYLEGNVVKAMSPATFSPLQWHVWEVDNYHPYGCS